MIIDTITWMCASKPNRVALCTFIMLAGLAVMDAQEKQEHDLKYIQLGDDLSVAYTEQGSSENTILFLHGLGSSLKAFDKLLDGMDEEQHCLALNYPRQVDTFSLINYAKIINQFLQKKNIERVTLAGHSMGAQIAMHYALLFPDKVHKLVLIAPAGIETFNEKDREWFAQYVTKTYYKSFTLDRVKYNFNINFYGGQIPDDALFMYKERAQIMSDSVAYDKYLDYYLGCIRAMLAEPVYEDLHKINAEVLIVFGADDLLIPNRILHPELKADDLMKQAKQVLPHCQIVMLNECGHFAVWDKAMEIAQLIKDFN